LQLHAQYFPYKPFRAVIALKQTHIAQTLKIIAHHYEHILCLLMLVQPTYNRERHLTVIKPLFP